MSDRRIMPRVKRVLLVALAIAGSTVSSCGFSLQDVRYNIVGGTMSFVKAYTTDLWEALLPAWEDILNPTDE